MTKKQIPVGMAVLVAFSLLVSACSPQAVATDVPTVDANAIYTQAAQTLQAGQSMTQAARPTDLPTATIEPTFTMDPIMAAGLTATAGAILQPGATTPGATTPGATTPGAATTGTTIAGAQVTPVTLPSATKAVVAPPPASTTGDKCEWVSNNPPDNAKIPKNADFDVSIKIKNSGTTTWDARYALRYFGGERMGAPTDYYLQNDVAPNEMYTFLFTMKAPDSSGKKETLMVVQNPDGRTMCWVNLPLEITD